MNKEYEEMMDFADQAMEKLKEDKDFQRAISKYEEAEERSHKISSDLAEQIVSILNLQDNKQTIEEARFNLIVAKMTAAKLLSMLSSFSYTEDEYMEGLVNARKVVQDELVPMLMQKEPCGECEECKNGHKDRCIQPKIRDSYCESRFLPLLSDSLIEYDAWNEILYESIPQDKREIDLIKDINDDLENKKRKEK